MHKQKRTLILRLNGNITYNNGWIALGITAELVSYLCKEHLSLLKNMTQLCELKIIALKIDSIVTELQYVILRFLDMCLETNENIDPVSTRLTSNPIEWIIMNWNRWVKTSVWHD